MVFCMLNNLHSIIFNTLSLFPTLIFISIFTQNRSFFFSFFGSLSIRTDRKTTPITLIVTSIEHTVTAMMTTFKISVNKTIQWELLSAWRSQTK